MRHSFRFASDQTVMPWNSNATVLNLPSRDLQKTSLAMCALTRCSNRLDQPTSAALLLPSSLARVLPGTRIPAVKHLSSLPDLDGRNVKVKQRSRYVPAMSSLARQTRNIGTVRLQHPRCRTSPFRSLKTARLSIGSKRSPTSSTWVERATTANNALLLMQPVTGMTGTLLSGIPFGFFFWTVPHCCRA